MKFCRNKQIPVFQTGKDVLSVEDISRLLFESEKFTQKYRTNENYYFGKHAILERQFDDPSKPNNKLVVGFPKYITQIRTGYFSSSPLSLDSENKNYLHDINEVLETNDFKKIFSELDTYASIYGHTFLALYLNEQGEIKMSPQKPMDWIYVRDNTLEQKPRFAIRYYAWFDDVTNTQMYDVELWTDREIINYEGSPMNLKEISRRPHYFNGLPVLEFSENESRKGCYEDVINLVDAYESILSDSVNTINYFSDCYLVLENVDADEQDILRMKQNKVIVLPENSSAQFLMKNINETYNKNTLNDIREAIFVVACCPLLSDSSFSSNSSGVAVSYKLFSMEKSVQNKENEFRKNFNRMFALIRDMINLKEAKKYGNEDRIILTFTRSNPIKDLTSIADAISKLRGTVSTETLLAQLDFCTDVQLEKEKLNREKEEDMDFQMKYMDIFGQDLDHSIDEESIGGDDEEGQE